MTYLAHFPYLFFVDLYTQARIGQSWYKPVLVVEYAGVNELVEKVSVLIVMDTQALLLYKCVGRTKIELQGCC